MLQVDTQFSEHYLLKVLYFLQLTYFGTFVKHQRAGLHVFMVGSSFFVSLVCMTVSGLVRYCFYYYGSEIYLEIWNSNLFSIVPFAEDCFCIWGCLWFHMNFSIFFLLL